MFFKEFFCLSMNNPFSEMCLSPSQEPKLSIMSPAFEPATSSWRFFYPEHPLDSIAIGIVEARSFLFSYGDPGSGSESDKKKKTGSGQFPRPSYGN